MKISRATLWTWAVLTTACGSDNAGRQTMDDPRSMDMPGGAPADTAMSMQMERQAAERPIRLTSRQASLAGVTFAVAREAALVRTVRAVATVVPDERRLGVVSARVDGWVERLHVEETGRWISEGEPLLDLYAPDLVTAQEELLLARRLGATAAGDSLISAARRRLSYWDISEQQIAELERTGIARRTLTLRSAFPGHVLEKRVIEGQRIRAGDNLFRVADLSSVWIEPSIFERDLHLVGIGQTAEVAFEALPGERFVGRVTFIHPMLDERTRTVRVRVELANPGFRIKPMMYGTVRIEAVATPTVTVPLTAVLPTGDRNLAFVVRGGEVLPREVTVGDRGNVAVSVLDGIAAGDTVVASATFLFDSESSLAAAMQGIMLNMGMGLDMGGMDMGSEADAMDMAPGDTTAPPGADTIPEGQQGGAR